MITFERMSPAADAAGARYQVLVDAWQSVFVETLNFNDFGSERALVKAGEQAYAIARTYLEAEAGFVSSALSEIASEALTDASRDLGMTSAHALTEPAGALLSATQAYLLREITIQIERDVAQLQQSLRQTALQMKLVASAQGISLRQALIHHRLSSREAPAFYFRDRRNAKWPSRLFIRSTWRQALLSAFNEVTLSVLAQAGIATAEVRHAHGKAGVDGLVIAFGSNSALPAYGEIRNEIFHPNADAILVVPEAYRSAA